MYFNVASCHLTLLFVSLILSAGLKLKRMRDDTTLIYLLEDAYITSSKTDNSTVNEKIFV